MDPDAAPQAGPEPKGGPGKEGLDGRLFVALRTRAHPRPLELAVIVLSTTGNWGLFWVGLGLVFWAGGFLAGPRHFIYLLLVIYITLIINYAVKTALRRERPVPGDPSLGPLVGTPSSKSFPSSHAAMSFAAACALAWLYTPLWPLYFGVAFVMSWSRVYVGVHYPSDVLAGTGLGLVMGAVAVALMRIV